MKPRILLLNPPGRRNYCRDYFVGGVLEAALRLPPQDLVTLSGILSPHGDLLVIDALAQGLSRPQAFSKASGFSPDIVAFLIGGASFGEDTQFLAQLKERFPRAQLIGMGDVYRDIKEMAFSLHPFLDAVLLDFGTQDIVKYLEGPNGPCDNVLFKNAEGLIAGPERHHYGDWPLPTPRWDLFPLKDYGWPFAGAGSRATLLTDYGCPYPCTYCPASSFAHKFRDLKSVRDEIRLLKSLGVRHVLFRDQTFGAHPDRTLELLELLRSEGAPFSWVCSTRVDLVYEERLNRMKRAGCAGVAYGIDSGDDEILRAHKKNTTRRQAVEALKLTRRCGLKTWGTFVLGLALDTRESVERTLRLAAELPLDHVSLQVDSQRYAADYRREMLVGGLVPPEAMPPDTPTTISVWQGRLGISNQDVFDYQAKGLRAARRLVRA